jgi:hypothetical protein
MAPGPREMRPRALEPHRPPRARLALAHGAYLLGAGLWPIVSLRTLKKVTGPKPEGWLTRGVGACLANIGLALTTAGVRGKVSQELRLLGGTVALSFAAMDFWYAGVRRRISPVYLANGTTQLAFAALWAIAELRERNAARRRPEAAFA